MAVGLPARYVSSYLSDAKLRPGAIVAPHAWAEEQPPVAPVAK